MARVENLEQENRDLTVQLENATIENTELKTKIEQIQHSKTVLNSNIEKLNRYYETRLAMADDAKERLREVIGDMRTELKDANNENKKLNSKIQELESAGSKPQKNIWCVCRRPAYGQMIGCNDINCRTNWFHMDCLGLSTRPEGDWFCDSCNHSK